MPPLRIAVIGAGAEPGSRARQYLATIARLPDHYVLAAVCDRNAEVSRQAAATYGAEAHLQRRAGTVRGREARRGAQSGAERLAHRDCADGGAASASTCLTEIPVAHTRRYAAAIAQACRDNGVLWEIAEQVWVWPQEQLKQRLLAAGHIGQVTHARLWYQTGQYHGFSGVRPLIGAEATRVLGHSRTVPTAPYTAYGGEAGNDGAVGRRRHRVRQRRDVPVRESAPPISAPHLSAGVAGRMHRRGAGIYPVCAVGGGEKSGPTRSRKFTT